MGKNVFLNGNIVDINKAVIPVTDRGFLYGDGIFETLRVYDGFPFQLKAHLKRLAFSAQQLGIVLPSLEEIESNLKKLICSNGTKDGVLRITVSRGASKQRSLVEEDLKSNILIQTFDLPQIPESNYSRGVNALSIEDNRGEICHFKSTNLLPNIVTKKLALQKNCFEAIMVSKRGFVTEGTTSNVFGVIDGNLITPPVGKKVLNGVTRQVIIKIADQYGIRVHEDALMGNELSIVSELFVTNSVIEIMPVTFINDNMISDGHAGKITTRLLNGYRTVINSWLKTQKQTVV